MLVVALGCASIPDRQYGIEDIDWAGVEEMSSEDLAACLATREREAVGLRLGISAPSCGVPPFDDSPPSAELWSYPWTVWPVYDPAIVAVDRERIVRWYQARGFYDAAVTRVLAYSGGEPIDSPRCPRGSSCELRLIFQVSEGEPVIVREVTLELEGAEDPGLREALAAQIELEVGQRFDEALYEADKEGLAASLRNASHARAETEGRVMIDRRARIARVTYRVRPGPACVFGRVSVETSADIPEAVVVQAAALNAGAPYSADEVDDAQQAVFALGVFSSVKMQERYVGDGSIVDVVILAERGRLVRPSAGVGIMSGTLRRVTSDELTSVPQWDVHLRLAYEHRNFLGGLRRLRIEERPRVILLDNFPAVPSEGPRLGNVLSVVFEQPAALEARTEAFSNNEWDYGPDAFYGYFRHDLAVKIGLRRAFLRQRLHAQIALEHDLYRIVDETAPDRVSSYRLPFVEQHVRLDLRDDARRPTTGAYAALTVQEAFRLGGYGSWRYLRIIPDVRGYAPLAWDVVLAARFALGAIVIFDSDDALDATSAALGPQSYRFRGGGASGNRGFYPGTLGSGIDGGKRRWEGSLELRVPLFADVGAALFSDVGDVSETSSFRFAHLNTSAGFGLRYYTVVGAIRFDAGWRIPGMQRAGGGGEQVEFGVLPSAIHLTIGEAF